MGACHWADSAPAVASGGDWSGAYPADKYEISLEGYYKTMDNVIEYKEGASFAEPGSDWQTLVEVGDGWSYGAELLLQKKAGRTTGWLGYTLSWTNRQFDNLNLEKSFLISMIAAMMPA